MKKFILIIAALIAFYHANAQQYIENDVTNNGVRHIIAKPAIFYHQSELYILAWNYLNSADKNVDNFCLSVSCYDQAAPWNVSAGDKIYLGELLENKYIELTALMDAAPEAYETENGIKYKTSAYYFIPKNYYDKLYKGFDRFKIDVKVKNKVPVTLDVKLPYSAIEHMLLSYLDIMIATGR